ncbi:hypothetical protein DRQ25_04720 [Candidatus Fermentibacteria bacterium]|nr:MAG: hypothetical protein DRQ25_04720 [Candidatus Fermentibacteria bacterium]
MGVDVDDSFLGLLEEEDLLDKLVVRLENYGRGLSFLHRFSLLQVASIYMPPLRSRGRGVRSSMHLLIVGDISSNKTTHSKLMEKISPKSTKIDAMSDTEVVGVSKRVQGGYERQPSVSEKANDGLLILSEFDKAVLGRHAGVFRGVLDNDRIDVAKGGESSSFRANISVLASMNPIKDTFTNGRRFIQQIKMKSGDLSRFDYIMPMFLVEGVVDEITDSMIDGFCNPFDEGLMDLSKIKRVLEEIKSSIQGGAENPRVRYLLFDKNKLRRLRDRLYSQNIRWGVPNLPRDMEHMIRVISASAGFHIHQRQVTEDGGLIPTREDYENAATWVDEYIHSHRTLYQHTQRSGVKKMDELIYEKIRGEGTVQLKALADNNGVCGRSSLYNIISRLEDQNRIIRKKKGRNEYVSTTEQKNTPPMSKSVWRGGCDAV